MAQQLPPALLQWAHAPLVPGVDTDVREAFFALEEVGGFYNAVVETDRADEVQQACAALFPQIAPLRATVLALMCGGLVERGADPEAIFAPCCELMASMLERAAPWVAEERDPEEEEDDPEAFRHWQATQRRVEAMSPAERFEADMLQQGVDTLVLPMMAMLMRSVRNHAQLLQRTALVEAVERSAPNASLPFEQLFYLSCAIRMSFDTIAVVLPASGTGFIAKVHAANTAFHAFSMLQPLMAEHAQALGIRQPMPITWTPGSDDDSDRALFHWLSAKAYRDGQLVNDLALAWGEAALRELPRRQGRVVLVALETDERPKRGWNGFNRPIHDHQNPHVTLERFLSAEEVAAHLQ